MIENQPPELDPATFNLDEWLTDDTDRSHRPARFVDVYRDLALAEEINSIAEERQARKAGAAALAVDEAVGDPQADNDLSAREEELLARLQGSRVRLTVVGLIRPEMEAATKDYSPDNPDYDYALLAESVTFPGGKKLTVDQWRRFHNTIGQGQFQRIVQAFKVATYTVPEVSAPFSRKS